MRKREGEEAEKEEVGEGAEGGREAALRIVNGLSKSMLTYSL